MSPNEVSVFSITDTGDGMLDILMCNRDGKTYLLSREAGEKPRFIVGVRGSVGPTSITLGASVIPIEKFFPLETQALGTEIAKAFPDMYH